MPPTSPRLELAETGFRELSCYNKMKLYKCSITCLVKKTMRPRKKWPTFYMRNLRVSFLEHNVFYSDQIPLALTHKVTVDRLTELVSSMVLVKQAKAHYLNQ